MAARRPFLFRYLHFSPPMESISIALAMMMAVVVSGVLVRMLPVPCLLYTSDAADE